MNARKSLTDMTDLDPAKPRRKRLKTLGIRFVATCVLLSAVAVIAVLSLVGTRLAAPDWVRSHLTTKINADLSGLSLDVAEVSILLQDNWVPEISMQSVVIADDIGTPLVKLSDVQGTADLSERTSALKSWTCSMGVETGEPKNVVLQEHGQYDGPDSLRCGEGRLDEGGGDVVG